MKHLIVIANGLSDQPIAEKDNRTPLQLADTPNLDRLSGSGRTGSVRTIPENLSPAPQISYLALLGYDPKTEAVAAGHCLARGLEVPVSEGEMPLCCDFIILQSSHNDMIVKDYTAGQLSAEDARMLVAALQESIVSDDVQFHPGGGYQNLMVLKTDSFPSELKPPNELIGEGIRKFIPQEKPYRELVHLMNEAQVILHNHPFNRKRTAQNLDAVNSVWFWGNGTDRPLPSFESRFGRQGALITASTLFKGLGKAVGLTVPNVEGATGFVDTDYSAKVTAALAALDSHDVVYLHVAGAEPVSLMGMIDDKVAAIEDFDEHIMGPLLDAAERRGNLKILVTENHMSSADLMRYKEDPVPFAVFPAASGGQGQKKFEESMIQTDGDHFQSGPELIRSFLEGAL